MTSPSRIARTAAVAALCFAGSIAAAQQPTHAPTPGPVKPADIPKFQHATLANGLRILLVQSARQPVVSLALMLPAGDAYDPAGKEGLASLTAALLTKGAGTRTADQVSADIEGVGGSMSAASATDFLTLRANVLRENAPLAFELVADAVARPTFATKELELARTQALSALQLEESQPAALASRFFAAQLFGAHPYGRHATPASVRALTDADLRTFQRTRLVPPGALLVVAGDISLEATVAQAQRQFGAWHGVAPTTVARARTPTRAHTEILLVHRPGSVQSNIIVGNLTHPPASPSYYALTVGNRILGGGSDGRLFKTLREQKSWTYGAYSSAARNRDVGTFQATAEVRTTVTDSALVELLRIERSLGAATVPVAELDASKGGLVGSLPLQLETAQGIAEQVGRYTMLGLPDDFIRTLRPRLAAVTGAEVQRAAKAYMRADQSLVVVVGDGAQLYDKLAKVAPTRIVNAQGEAMSPSDLVQKVSMLPVDFTRIAERADSFTVLVQGSALGYETTSLRKTATGYAYRLAMAVGPFVQQTIEVTFGSDLAPQGATGSGKVQGQPVTVDVTYANGRARGSGMSPGPTGIKTVTVDTAVAAGVLDDNMLTALVPGLHWAPGARFSVTVFDAAVGTMKPVTMSVAGTESVTVPAGTFAVYRVDVVGGTQPMTFFVTTAAPYRIVKMIMVGTPVEFLLVR